MKRLMLVGLLCCLVVSCGGRLPPRHRSQRLLQHYFERYAKKYPTTAFGQHPVKKVEVSNETEIRKNVAAVEAYLTLGNDELRKINATLERKTFGWTFRSWENPEGS